MRPALFHFQIFASIIEIVLNNNGTFAKFNKKNIKRDNFVLSHISDILCIFIFK